MTLITRRFLGLVDDEVVVAYLEFGGYHPATSVEILLAAVEYWSLSCCIPETGVDHL